MPNYFVTSRLCMEADVDHFPVLFFNLYKTKILQMQKVCLQNM